MPSNPPSKRLLLGTAAGAALTTVCLAYNNSNSHPHSSLEHLITAPTRHSSGMGVMENDDHAAFVWGSDNNTYQDDDGMESHQEEDRSMMWAFLQVGTILFLGVCSYYMSGEKENIKVEMQSN